MRKSHNHSKLLNSMLFIRLIQTVISFVILGVGLLPTWIFLFVWNMTNPSTFWQKLITIALGAFLGGPIQFWFFVILVGAIVTLWSEP